VADDRGWPDPLEPCVPPDPERAGPHLFVDEYSEPLPTISLASWLGSLSAWVFSPSDALHIGKKIVAVAAECRDDNVI
jgi:hypothetical protein